MDAEPLPSARRLQRLADELTDDGIDLDHDPEWRRLLLTEIDYALRPLVHERRVPSVGSIVEPTTDPMTWQEGTELSLTRGRISSSLAAARLFADGLSSFLIRAVAGTTEWAVFDRPTGSERDLVVLAEVLGATLVQRHPTGLVRVVGSFGVLRWDGVAWHREPPITTWIDAVAACPAHGDREVLELLLEFAVHDLGSRGIGAILIYRPDDQPGPVVEQRLPAPPALQIRRPSALAPFRHALGQIDGAAVLDASGTLRQLGVRLVPSLDAESSVAGLRGTRHTAGRRYSYDDPTATVIVVSEDGPVTVLRNGDVLGSSSTVWQHHLTDAG